MCNNNTDLSDTENCDRQTGDCLKCLYNTSGSHCEKCKSGFYGDALMKTCKGMFKSFTYFECNVYYLIILTEVLIRKLYLSNVYQIDAIY